MARQAYKGSPKTLGEEHTDTLAAMRNLGISLDELRKSTEAEIVIANQSNP